MLKVYHNELCSKSRATLAFIEELNLPYAIQLYISNPPNKEELMAILQKLKMRPYEIIRKNEPVFIEKFNGKSLTDIEWIEILVENPILIERPIVVLEDKATIGRPLDNVQRLLADANLI